MHFLSEESLLTQTSQPPWEQGPGGLALMVCHLPAAYMKGL